MKTIVPDRALSLGFGLVAERKTTSGSKRMPVAPRAKLLVVDSDPTLARQTVSRLHAADYAVESVDSAKAAIDGCHHRHPNLIVADLAHAGIGYVEFLKAITNRRIDLPVIVLTSRGSIPEAVKAIQAGAFAYLVKPIDRSELLGHIERALAQVASASANQDWREQIAARSRLLEQRLRLARRAATGTMPILLTGKSDGAMELYARAIHAASGRHAHPFVIVNCAHGTEESLQRELLGEPVLRRDGTSLAGGAIDRAQRGTLLLENVGKLSLDLQRTLFFRVVRQSLSHDVNDAPRDAAQRDVRLISSGVIDPHAALGGATLLENLFAEMAPLTIGVPPIGRRREDLPQLVAHLLGPATEHANAREITAQALQLLPNEQRAPTAGYDEARDEFARAYLEESLARTGGNVSRAARTAKRQRTDMYKLLARYGLEPRDFKSDQIVSEERGL